MTPMHCELRCDDSAQNAFARRSIQLINAAPGPPSLRASQAAKSLQHCSSMLGEWEVQHASRSCAQLEWAARSCTSQPPFHPIITPALVFPDFAPAHICICLLSPSFLCIHAPPPRDTHTQTHTHTHTHTLHTLHVQSDLLDDTSRVVMPKLNELLIDQGQRFTNYFVGATWLECVHGMCVLWEGV